MIPCLFPGSGWAGALDGRSRCCQSLALRSTVPIASPAPHPPRKRRRAQDSLLTVFAQRVTGWPTLTLVVLAACQTRRTGAGWGGLGQHEAPEASGRQFVVRPALEHYKASRRFEDGPRTGSLSDAASGLKDERNAPVSVVVPLGPRCLWAGCTSRKLA